MIVACDRRQLRAEVQPSGRRGRQPVDERHLPRRNFDDPRPAKKSGTNHSHPVRRQDQRSPEGPERGNYLPTYLRVTEPI